MDGISTLLPVYLGSTARADIAALIRAAQSVLSQETTLPLELVIVDDGSVPPISERPELQELLRSPQVNLIELRTNSGLVYALNVGLSQARYSLIGRIDADDVWRPGKLMQQIRALQADEQLTLIASSMHISYTATPESSRDDVRGGDWLHALRFVDNVGCPFPHGSILARRDVFDLLGGYSHSRAARHCEDFALWSIWIRFFKAAVLNEVLLEYTCSATQISSTFASEQKVASDRIRREFRANAQYHLIPDSLAHFASELQLPLLTTSKLLCAAWIYYTSILVEDRLLAAARVLFPDREIVSVSTHNNGTSDGLAVFLGAPHLLADTGVASTETLQRIIDLGAHI